MYLDTDGIEALITLYGADIYAFCKKLTRNKYDSDDLYQQTFLKALEVKQKIKADINPKSFLISLAIGIWKNTVRKKTRRRHIAPEAELEPDILLLAENADDNVSDSVFNTVVTAETQREVAAAVNNLHTKYRLPVIMLYTLDMPVREISDVLKLPQGTVKSRLHKARELIKNDLEVKGYGKDK